MDEQSSDLPSWAGERTSGGLAQKVVQKLAALTDSDRDRAANFVKQKYSWKSTFSRQMNVYENGR
jgi:hypothetical protein